MLVRSALTTCQGGVLSSLCEDDVVGRHAFLVSDNTLKSGEWIEVGFLHVWAAWRPLRLFIQSPQPPVAGSLGTTKSFAPTAELTTDTEIPTRKRLSRP
jgi:hypothetical protein